MKRSTLIVIENTSNHGAILQDHVAGRCFLSQRRVLRVGLLDHDRGLRQCLRLLVGLVTAFFQNRLLDSPQATHLLPHLNLGDQETVQLGGFGTRQVAELLSVKPEQGFVDGGEHAKPIRGNRRGDKPAILRRPGTLNVGWKKILVKQVFCGRGRIVTVTWIERRSGSFLIENHEHQAPVPGCGLDDRRS
jgi:hypothetical protein